MDIKSGRPEQGLSQDFNPSDYHLFYGLKGRQGKRNFYSTTLKLREVFDAFKFVLEEPEKRGDYSVHATKSGRKKITKHRDASVDRDVQRIRSPKKVDQVVDYLIKKPDAWIFSSLTASCGAEVIYRPVAEDARIGKFYVRKGSHLLINDGQHRADAIGTVWNRKLLDGSALENFGDQSISVVIYEEPSLRGQQAMFLDLQKGTPVNKSLQNELDPSLDKALVREVRDSIPFFKSYTVSDETSIAKGSRKLFTLACFCDANQYVFGTRLTKKNYAETRDFLVQFWDVLSKSIVDWEPFLEDGGIDTDEFRNSSLSHLSVTMHAFGMIASRLHHNPEKYSLTRSLPRLRGANFQRRSNSQLERKYGSTTKNQYGERQVRLANNKSVRMAIREHLWEKVLGYKKVANEADT